MKKLRRPLFKYFGSKWQSAKHYPAPKHDIIIEPFCGSACYASHYPDRQVILIDKDPEVVELLNYLIRVDINEILSLPVTSLVEGQNLLTRLSAYSRGAALLISRWQRVGRNDCKTVSKWNNTPGQWQESVKIAIAESLFKIRHWRAICADYNSAPLQNIKATWFIDPPYQYVKGYKYDMTGIDYMSLAQWCKRRRGQVIVCEQEGANWLPFEPFRKVTSGRTKEGGTRNKKQEVIWYRDE